MTEREIKAVVVMHYDESGWFTIHTADPDGAVVLLTVDDRVPHDRVYEHLDREPVADVLALAPRPWGNQNDDRHKATLTKLARMESGLTVIEGGAA